MGYIQYTTKTEIWQVYMVYQAFAPRDRYQVVEAILKKGRASSIKSLWKKLKKEEPRLWPAWLTGES
jgi:hypothetical protein